MRGLPALLVPLLVLGVAGAVVSARHAVGESAPKPTPSVRPRAPLPVHIAPVPAPIPTVDSPATPPDPRFASLKALTVRNVNSGEALDVALYDPSGHVSDASARTLDQLLCDARDPDHRTATVMDRRLLQLVYRSAYHFRAREIIVISGYRRPGRHREGLHANGTAIDFKLRSVPAAELAAYLRTLSKVGVGVYTNARTQFVHLDVRENSYHWLDGSPPGRTWRALSIGGKTLARRDLAYRHADDWPEGTTPPAE